MRLFMLGISQGVRIGLVVSAVLAVVLVALVACGRVIV
jgi:hypothetical protein